MATKADTKKHLEAILGQKLSEDEVQLVQFVFPIASRTFTSDENTSTTLRTFLIPVPNQCRPARLLDISGLATTDNSGKRVFRLSEFLCNPSPESIQFQQPINVVATPRSTTPFFLTVTHSLVNPSPFGTATDVQITVFMWDANGAAAPNVTFDWRCRVDIPNLVF